MEVESPWLEALVFLSEKQRPAEARFLVRKTCALWQGLERTAGLASKNKINTAVHALLFWFVRFL